MLANSLGLDFETRNLQPRPAYIRGKPRFRASLDHLEPTDTASLQPPWPDLVITTGRRHAMAALWIKQQSPRTRIVLLGRPRRWIEKFDLVITLPQYRLPALDNVMNLSFPLMRADRQAVANAGRIWSDRLSSLDKPVTAVFTGGPTQPYRFDKSVTAELIAACFEAVEGKTGSLYFVTSPRTSPAIAAALEAGLPDNARLYRWQKDDTENPYLALLGLADRFVVTGDSISMMVEVADLGKPLAIYPLPTHLRGRIWPSLNRRLSKTGIGKLLYRTGISGFPRDLSVIHRSLVNKGLASFLGDGFRTPVSSLPNELTDVRDRILALL